jgi:hypothetical protein
MTVVVWIVATLALIFVLKFVLQLITGLLVPRSISGALLLKQQLKANGVATERLPQQFFDDCVTWAEGVALFEAKSRSKSAKHGSAADFADALHSLARVAALWVREPESTMFKSYGEATNGYRALFENYDLKWGR